MSDKEPTTADRLPKDRPVTITVQLRGWAMNADGFDWSSGIDHPLPALPLCVSCGAIVDAGQLASKVVKDSDRDHCYRCWRRLMWGRVEESNRAAERLAVLSAVFSVVALGCLLVALVLA